MYKFLKDNWFIISFIVAPLLTGLAFLFSLNSRIYDSPEQKIEHITHVENAPSPKQELRAYILDSLNTTHAIKSRKMRDSLFKAQDSLNKLHDSIMLDYVQKNAEQIYQIKQQISDN